jgi:hypothetical protein
LPSRAVNATFPVFPISHGHLAQPGQPHRPGKLFRSYCPELLRFLFLSAEPSPPRLPLAEGKGVRFANLHYEEGPMRKLWTLTLGVLLGGTSLVPAQTPASPTRLPQPGATPGALLSNQPAQGPQRLEPLPESAGVVSTVSSDGDDGDNAHFWASGEYLLWWFKGGPTPPLVTTGNPANPLAGTIGVNRALTDTTILFGATAIDYQALSGLRATIGGWIDSDRCFGVEGGGFYVPKKTVGFSASSDAGGNPPLFVPVFVANAGMEGVFPIANPATAANAVGINGAAGLSGSIAISSTTELWGSEINAVASVVRRDGFQVNALLGFRYMDLRESLTLNAPNLFDFTNGITGSVADRFDTRNQFYGGQIGAWIAYRSGIFSAEVTGKLALGENYQVINIQGNSMENSPTGVAPSGTFPGGIFAQPTNIGRHAHEQLTVIPEVKVLAGVNVFTNFRLFVTYDFLYWNQVVRPGAQIDRNVNVTQSPFSGPMGGALVGPVAPQPQYNRTEFWAQGVSAGFELRF